MIDLFSAEGVAALERIAHAKTLYAFDFDGTLAPIVELPDYAAAAASTVSLLSRLGTLVPTVILTGRAVDDIRRRIAFTPRHLVGNHGAEGVPDRLHHSLADSLGARGGNAAHREVVQGWLAQWPAAIAAQADVPGIFIEPKSYSLSVHHRLAEDQDAAIRVIHAAIGRLEPAPRIIGGKCVFNLLPEGAPDKGSALRSLVQFEQSDGAFFIGDDLTDEAAFENAPASWMTVRVGLSEDSSARYFIATQGDIDRCLQHLLAHVEAAATRQPSVDTAEDHGHAGEGLPGR